ncbi:hypothetical protein GGR54DRAFT_610952 [Hypoxylon sp. NC1633]|nr:hypothetical protein GGR54DRAFT_610952 [Hypoxylon sp. NC1633]
MSYTPSSSSKNPGAQFTSWHRSTGRGIYPSMDDPEETKKEVRDIYKKTVPHSNAASEDLAVIFGLGNGQVARQRVQGLFTHPAFLAAFYEFELTYLRGEWGLPVGEWEMVRKVFQECSDSPGWAGDTCPTRKGWKVNHYYNRFIIRTLHGIRQPRENTTQRAYWLKEEPDAEKACWVLFHALLYLQLITMRGFKKRVSVMERIIYFLCIL